MSTRECTLRLALGEHEACPGASCELWHEGTCLLDSVRPELSRSPALARYLLDLRMALDVAASTGEQACARSLFYRRLNEEQAAEA